MNAPLTRPSFGRPKKVRGLDQFDTPPIALDPLFAHEPLLTGVTTICEPCCGRGNLVMAMRAKGIKVRASDIQYRGCPDSTVLDFLEMTRRPDDCDVLVSNFPYDGIAGNALQCIEHAFTIGFRLVILLLKTRYLNGEKRHRLLYPRGHLRRVYPFDGRLQNMHDANFTGEKSSQNEDHGWFVFDRTYCGPAQIFPVSLKNPTARMPWAEAPDVETVKMTASRQDFLTQAVFSRARRLLPHQVEQAIFAVERKHSLNASETGSGKFLVALAMRRLIEHEAGRIVKCLYTCPKSALGQFEQEFADHGYRTFVLRHGHDIIPADADTSLVANSALLVTHRDQLRSWCPFLVVLDEAVALNRGRGAHQGRLRQRPRPRRRDY